MQVQRIEDVRKRQEIPAEPKGVTCPPIPAEYYEYRKRNDKGNKKRAKKDRTHAYVNPKRKGGK